LPTDTERRTLEVWLTKDCKYCIPVKDDFRDADFVELVASRYDILYCDGDNPANTPDIRQRGITGFPAFVIQETGECWDGYAGGREALLKRLKIDATKRGFKPPAGSSDELPPLTNPESPPADDS